MSLDILSKLDFAEIGKELADARKMRSLTQADVAQMLDIARTTIIAIEKGERKIKAEELVRFAEVYGKQVKDFLRKGISFEPRSIQFRSTLVHTDKEKEDIENYLLELKNLCRNYIELEELCKINKIEKNNPIYTRIGIPVEEASEEIARKERTRLELGDSPLPNLRDFLEEKTGLKIFYIPMNSKISGMYFFDKDLGGCMAINKNHPESKRRMSLAHEYGHFLADRYLISVSMEENYKKMPESEKFAENFAYNFVLPPQALKYKYYEIKQATGVFTPRDIVLLSYHFGASFQVTTLRLESLKLVPNGLYERLNDKGIKVKEIEEELGLKKINSREDKFPLGYQLLAATAYYQEIISEGQLSKYLGLDRIDTRIFLEEYDDIYMNPLFNQDLSESKLEEIGV